jgi:hypothetical protein
MRLVHFFRAGAAALVLTLTGCNQLEKLDASGSGGDGEVPAEVQAAFERSCGNSTACHKAGGQSPTLEGAGISGLIGTPSTSGLPLVTLGDTSNSYIAIKMLPDDVIAGLGATRVGTRMPQAFDYATGSADTLADTQVILAWIGGATFTGGGETGGESTGDPTGGGEPTFTRVQDEIFKGSCSCHLAAANEPLNGNLSLLVDDAYANIVNVKSLEATTTNFITPNDPAASYLYLKVTGDFLDVAGGAPDPMPLGGAMLDADKIKLLEDWILAGAMDN